jgi:plastocyanin domain-containing protein
MMLGQRASALALPVVLAFFAAGTSACKAKDKGTGAASALPAGAVQVVADDKGFTPSSVTFKKGAPGSLVFLRTSDDTCATEVVFPELNVKKELPKGQPVTIAIPTEKEQKLTFQCGMGMYKSAVVIN